jgi:phenylpyruvate tautomerase PptA (4-oxalocrotonate tautomerase family)
MPILDIECVLPAGSTAALAGAAQRLADTAGRALGSKPGHTWVRLRMLDATAYAENDATLDADGLPVFVTVLHAHVPQGAALTAQVNALTQAVAESLGVDAQRVHVQMAPAAAGRQAFGGRLVE